MADIFQEVDEALQKERMEAFWRRWGPWLIAGAVAIVFITAAVVFYKDKRAQALTEATSKLMQARDADKPLKALSAFADNADNPHATYARMLAAGKALAGDDTRKAEDFYNAIVADDAAPGQQRDMARIMAVRTGLDQGDKKADALLARLKPVLANSKSPWYFHARLQAAVIHGAVKGNFSKGGEMLTALINKDNIPRGLGQRARRIKHIYAIRQQQSGDGA